MRIASSHASRSVSPRSRAVRKEAINLWISSWLSVWCRAFFFCFGILDGPVAQSFAQGEKFGGALLELAEGFDLGTVVADLDGIAQASGNGAPALVLEGVKGVGAAPHLLGIFTNGLDELFSDGAAANLIEVFDLGEELAAAGVELGNGGWNTHYVVTNTTYFRGKKEENFQTPFFVMHPNIYLDVYPHHPMVTPSGF